MSVFEEFGVMGEIIEAVEDLGWHLPTEIQAEAVPLILGGGDVLLAAETGSGKTGAFCLPVVQVTYEMLRMSRIIKNRNRHEPKEEEMGEAPIAVVLNKFDKDPSFHIAQNQLNCFTSPGESSWLGCRALVGVKSWSLLL